MSFWQEWVLSPLIGFAVRYEIDRLLTRKYRLAQQGQLDRIEKKLDTLLNPKRKTMPIYSQREPLWSERLLGDSGLTVGRFGCTMTCVAQALTDSGYPVTPGELVDQLNAIGGFTDHHHPQGPGLLIWKKVTELYPQFHFAEAGEHTYTFQQGTWGRFNHWVLKNPAHLIIDPYYGVVGEPAGFVEVSTRIANIEPAGEAVQIIFRSHINVLDGNGSPANANVRIGPGTQHPVALHASGEKDVIKHGAPLDWVEIVSGDGEAPDGVNNLWLKKPDEKYVWEGATDHHKLN